jgi:hypothetical protein
LQYEVRAFQIVRIRFGFEQELVYQPERSLIDEAGCLRKGSGTGRACGEEDDHAGARDL